ncbi:GNAT family N-acetyltransferase [Pedobacter sp. N23S346]|uniref:GNAT family N-acetyltransferase n=1 Tax=Pedobacter sp. N23S346 TaxID=3402750 RepID=UPI003ACB0646
MSFVSRLATLNDVGTLELLLHASVRSLSAGYYTPQQIESSLKYIFGIDNQLIEDQTYYLIENGDTIVACGGWSKRNTLYGGDQYKELADPLLDPSMDAARIRAFFVHPDWKRQGLGRMMINICEKAAIAHGFKSFELGSTLSGEALYTAMGYKRIEEEKVPLADGTYLQIIHMEKSI